MSDNISNFIKLRTAARKKETEAEQFESDVLEKIKKIRALKKTHYDKYLSGRVAEILHVYENSVEYGVSYCGCCENNGEDMSFDLLLMSEKDLANTFKDLKKEDTEKKLALKKQKDIDDKAARIEFEKKELKRLQKKYGK